MYMLKQSLLQQHISVQLRAVIDMITINSFPLFSAFNAATEICLVHFLEPLCSLPFQAFVLDFLKISVNLRQMYAYARLV